MKTGKTLQELAAELQRQRDARKDFTAPSKKVTMVTEQPPTQGDWQPPKRTKLALADNPMDVPEGMTFDITNHTHRQLGEFAKVPAKYYDRMAAEAPELLAMNVNHWLRQSPKSRMVRTLDGRARAFLSDRYRPLDNFELANAVLPKLKEVGADIESCEITERRMYLKAIVPDRRVEIPGPNTPDNWKWGEGHHSVHVLQPGIVISNSEIGAGSLAVQPAVHTVHCTNLAIFSDSGTRKYHVGRAADRDAEIAEYLTDDTKRQVDAAFWSQVRDLTAAALDGVVFEKLVDQVRQSRNSDRIEKPEKGIEEVCDRFQLSETEGQSVLAHLIEGGELSAYGMANAVTRAASDADSYDRASELEAVGAQIIELKPSEWQHIAHAA